MKKKIESKEILNRNGGERYCVLRVLAMVLKWLTDFCTRETIETRKAARSKVAVSPRWVPLSDLTTRGIPCSLKICFVKSATCLLVLWPLGIFLTKGCSNPRIKGIHHRQGYCVPSRPLWHFGLYQRLPCLFRLSSWHIFHDLVI